MLKYKIIPDDIVKNMIEFLDEIQFEAAAGNRPDDLQRINFCNWIISELMNGLDGFDFEDPEEKDKLSADDLKDRWDKIDSYRKTIGVSNRTHNQAIAKIDKLERDLEYSRGCLETKDKYWDKIRVERNSFLLEKQNLEEKVKELETELYFCRRNKLIGEIVDG